VCLGERRNRPDADLLVLEQGEPVRERASAEEAGELASKRSLVGLVLPSRELRHVEELAGASEEDRLERREREVPAVGGRVRLVAGEAAREQTRQRVASEAVCRELVGAVGHRDDEAGASSGATTPDERREHLCDRPQSSRREVRDLHRGRRRGCVLERAGPAEVVEVVAGAVRVPPVLPESSDRAVDDALRDVLRTYAEAGRDAGPEPFQHDVRTRAERVGEGHVALEVADDRFRPAAQRGIPGGGSAPHRIALRRLDADDTRAEATQLTARERSGEIPRQVDDEHPGEVLLRGVCHRPYSDRTLTGRSIARERASGDRQGGAEETRQRILDAAVRVFARRGFHTSRVGDIAEEAGVAHGLLYHYFASKDEVLETVFRENWGELLGRFAVVEASDEPADEKLLGLVKILLRTWRNDPDLVTVMVREVGRSAHLASQVDDIGRGFEVIQRVIEQGQAEGVFRAELDPRLASWVVYGGLEEILTGWVMGRLPDGDEEVARAERTIVDVLRGGLVRTPVVA